MRGRETLLTAWLILLVMVVAGSWNLVRVSRDDGPSGISGTAVPADQPTGPLLLEVAWRTASDRAEQWSSGATLSFASLQVDWPLDPVPEGPSEIPPGGWVRFAFNDPDRAERLSLQVERYTGQIVFEEVVPWTDYRPETLPIGSTAVTSGDALRIAEAAAGQSFRAACPLNRHRSDVILLASAGIPDSSPVDGAGTAVAGTPVSGTPIATPVTVDPAVVEVATASDDGSAPVRWLVTYRDDRDPLTNAIELEIAAGDGRILRFDDQSIPCD